MAIYQGPVKGFEEVEFAKPPIDLDRGVTGKKSWMHPEIGIVYAYKDDPGVYFNEHGTEVSEQVARLAGHDVEANARIRYLRQKRKEFDKELEAEMARVTKQGGDLLVSRGGFSVMTLAHGRCAVTDLDGQWITPNPLTREEAFKLLDKLSPVDPVAEGQDDVSE
ncbi:hypothetical protein [Sinorhizobium fredii]|uniref:Uncharacterized protein n=1 Tax=Rhizobium fredii TaxID=380 RepID=A0A2L0H8K8_RHIFR|nr:hypothetical protein [Sinorhizobium fredii]AUX77826.1 hypothetical protein NXT3_CH03284 [Sinorhizobium fredii]